MHLISIKRNNIFVFSQSCGVELGDLYVVIGGCDNTGTGAAYCDGILNKRAIRKVGLYNDNGFVKKLPDLIMGRYNHACAGFQDLNGDMVGVIFLYS